ncbi:MULTISPECIES: TIGR03885 family FMN-dependent LLM class oxidoreductase [unclassified Pseudomonas]|uniref:TIGR03885 family FMN-dependent LLM class oxidoreductase n=1 Tax=unclassified Pseudomonas TaxID=196821 RepID=UPI0024483563|nr:MULTISPECIES: TIGR03885 family FMN-dependent LLM class oxidoreductase [unclassified Pseudomonas]MDG9924228.1 TIGR03885 family FMN-dependent LLM class oxidoreductase [Pseudomonas sp. GD04045]MDH0036658.1 TIGR03885 family FMN-dependent LLM class oxidoreductase [Pseudomonas sp. GD04019]
MPVIGYHASHEQFPPGELLQLLLQAEHAGFAAGMCSDHFHPWSESQGESGFAWSWLGAALQGTAFDLGVVNTPCFRYHPALIAQASATLAQMYPGRFWLAVGSGEAINESITGERWPPKAERNARLVEAVAIIRALWAGEEVSCDGLIRVERARLYSLPSRPPALYAAVLSEETARWAGSWADGMITVSSAPEQQQRIVDAFRDGGGAGKPLLLQAKLSYAASDAEALAGAHQQWRTNVLPGLLTQDLNSVEAFEAAARTVRPEDLRDQVRIGSDLAQHAAWLHADLQQGFERIYLHNVNRHQQRFIEAFASSVLPQVR